MIFDERSKVNLLRCQPLSINIESCEIASEITVNDSIWVHHGDDFKDELLAQENSFACAS
jgi:hypothetical protein